jgi:hypothetical protein
VAEPWSDDLDALAARSRVQLRSFDATRASLSARDKETKMRFFKTHPALGAVIAILCLATFTSVAYAVVQRVWLSVDTSKSGPEMEQDMRDQLDQAGVKADVFVDKSDDRLKIGVRSTDPNAPEIGVRVNGRDTSDADTRRVELRVEVRVELSPELQQKLQAALEDASVRALVEDRPADMTDDQLAAKLRDALAALGFRDVDVAVASGSITITIKSAPTP